MKSLILSGMVFPAIVCCLFRLLFNIHHSELLSGLGSEVESSWNEGGQTLVLFYPHDVGSVLLQLILRVSLENTLTVINDHRLLLSVFMGWKNMQVLTNQKNKR